MSLPVVLFAVVGTATCVSALGVVASRDVVRMAVWLLFTLIGVSLTYFLLGAEFAGAAQLIVYVGGTLVLVVFGVMLTAQGPLRELRTRRVERAAGVVLGVALFAVLAVVSLNLGSPPAGEGPLPDVGPLGMSFLGATDASPKVPLSGVPTGTTPRTPTAYLLPFEVVSVHLLVVLVGAAYLARAKRKRTQP